MQIPKLLSKSKLMRGYQCHKSIYLTLHNKELEPPVSPEQQYVFDIGNEVGLEARKKFTGGALVDNKPWDFIGSLKKTRELLATHTHVIFEAAFEYKGCYARADVVKFNPQSGRWIIYEVKSSTKIKEEHLDDVGLQVWIMANSGLPIEQINIMHINNSCKYPDLSNLFTVVDVTDQLRSKYPTITPRLNAIFDTIKSNTVPEVGIGEHCDIPNECPFKTHCYSEAKIPRLSVLDLPYGGTSKWDIYNKNVINLDDPELLNFELTDLQKRVIETFKTNKRFIEINGIEKALEKFKYPIVFLDFETINFAIPRYINSSPYQQIPFQMSAHVLKNPNTELEHYEYLHTELNDPRPGLIKKLIEVCGEEGSIVAYFGKFESQRIKELADFDIVNGSKLEKLIDRIVDPLPIIKENVYDNEFCGSFSLKKVAPALLGLGHSYEGMLIDNGTAAQRAYLEIINPETNPERKKQLITASLDYCKKDTFVMVELYRWLLNASNSKKSTND